MITRLNERTKAELIDIVNNQRNDIQMLKERLKDVHKISMIHYSTIRQIKW